MTCCCTHRYLYPITHTSTRNLHNFHPSITRPLVALELSSCSHVLFDIRNFVLATALSRKIITVKDTKRTARDSFLIKMLISGSLSFSFSPASFPLIRYPFNNSARSPGRWMSRPRRSPCAHTRLRLPLWINYGGRSKEHATTKPVM